MVENKKVKEILKKQLELPISVKAVDDDDDGHTLSFIGSDETVDRYGDIVKADGWQLKNYKANPVFLWAHNSREMPIGRAEKVWVEDGKLKFKIKFAVEEYPFAKLAYDMYKAGYLNATSVGFMVKDWKFTDDNFVSLEQELLELSAVPVPANPSALRLGFTDDEIATLKEFSVEQKTLAVKTIETKEETVTEIVKDVETEPVVEEPQINEPTPVDKTAEEINEEDNMNKEFEERVSQLEEKIVGLSTSLEKLTELIKEKLVNPEQDTVVEQPVDEPTVVETTNDGENEAKTVEEEVETEVETEQKTVEDEPIVDKTIETEVVEQPENKEKGFSISIDEIRESLKAK